MTKEETISNLKAYLDGDMAIGNIIPLRSVLESAVKYLEPSIPANLDEAAGDYAIEVVPDNFIPDEGNGYKAAYTLPDIKDAFKAGAKHDRSIVKAKLLEWAKEQKEKLVSDSFTSSGKRKMLERLIDKIESL